MVSRGYSVILGRLAAACRLRLAAASLVSTDERLVLRTRELGGKRRGCGSAAQSVRAALSDGSLDGLLANAMATEDPDAVKTGRGRDNGGEGKQRENGKEEAIARLTMSPCRYARHHDVPRPATSRNHARRYRRVKTATTASGRSTSEARETGRSGAKSGNR
ncbi:hypothetical protein CDD83_10257 [Cordyceps sp. RAO-2017]|nr:hypothetical protein CDD83_10257 [Cordyceps sp. RAO-2017]